MPTFPGPVALGRGVVTLPGATLPEVCVSWPRVQIDDRTLDEPAGAADRLFQLWLERRPFVVVLATDPEALRAAERSERPVHELDPSFEFSRERLQFLVWSNTYDLRGTEPIWWHGRRAERLGATAGGETDVTLADGSPAWCDGGPRQPIELGDGSVIVHREEIESGRLRPDRVVDVHADLAPDQLLAVAHRVGPARVLAPAGSGKTRVLTERLRHLLADRLVTTSAVTAVAYNKRAADELAERTAGLGAHIRTLNSLGLGIVNGSRPFAPRTGTPRRVIEETEMRRILESLVTVRRQQNSDPWAVYLDALSAIRLGLADPRVVEEMLPDAAGIADAFGPYRAILSEHGLIDFDEQIYGAIELLLTDPVARRHNQALARHLLVDEFQDLTPAHLLLLRLLAAPAYDVFGVGDDDQVIYSYAGASPEFLIGYERYFPGASAYALETNYRCPPAVVTAARTLLGHNVRRVPKSIASAPGRPTRSGELAVDPRAAAEAAVATAEHIARFAEAGARWSDIAVLARVNSALLPTQVTLAESSIPCTMPLDESILGRTGIRTALSYLRIGADPTRIARADVSETIRRPSRRIARNVLEMLQRRSTSSLADLARFADALSGADVDKLHRYIEDLRIIADVVNEGTTAQVFRAIRQEVGLGGAMDLLDSSRRDADRSTHLDDLAALEQVAAIHPDPRTFELWLSEVLARPADQGGVTLSTVHRVKGREWPYVIVVGAKEGTFPHRLAEDLEEERRVFHVALTRGGREVVVLADRDDPSSFCAELFSSTPGRRTTKTARNTAGAVRRAASPQLAPSVEPTVGMTLVLHGGIHGVVREINKDGLLVEAEGARARLRVAWSDEVTVGGALVRLRRDGRPSPEQAGAALRIWRSDTARRDKVPAYVVFSDAHLDGIAAALPSSLEELARCRGVGPAKLEKYGDDLLGILESLETGTSPA